jgi:hypothetical protein
MFQPDLFAIREAGPALDLPAILERLADVSNRPRYTFMVLNLIAKAAGPSGRAGPYVGEANRKVPVRDWLSDAMMPMAQRDPKRIATTIAVREELARAGRLSADPVEARATVDAEVRQRVLRSGRCSISRAVSDLVKAGLVRRYYQGYRVDHANRGAQREAVYMLTPQAAQALGARH